MIFSKCWQSGSHQRNRNDTRATQPWNIVTGHISGICARWRAVPNSDFYLRFTRSFSQLSLSLPSRGNKIRLSDPDNGISTLEIFNPGETFLIQNNLAFKGSGARAAEKAKLFVSG